MVGRNNMFHTVHSRGWGGAYWAGRVQGRGVDTPPIWRGPNENGRMINMRPFSMAVQYAT